MMKIRLENEMLVKTALWFYSVMPRLTHRQNGQKNYFTISEQSFTLFVIIEFYKQLFHLKYTFF